MLLKNQYGFRPGKSTIDAFYVATNFIYNELDNNQKGIAVFSNQVKAFDTVVHNKLINILPGLRIKNESIDRFKSYFNNRKYMVSISGILSNEKKKTRRYPKGKVLVLFILDLFQH